MEKSSSPVFSKHDRARRLDVCHVVRAAGDDDDDDDDAAFVTLNYTERGFVTLTGVKPHLDQLEAVLYRFCELVDVFRFPRTWGSSPDSA